MRTTLTAIPIAFILAFLAIPAEACAQATPPIFEGEYPQCPTYDLASVGAEGTRLEVNAFGQFLLTYTIFNGVVFDTMYQTWDEPTLFGGPTQALFSTWTYQEGNDLPGLQRADDICNNTPNGYSSDLTIC